MGATSIKRLLLAATVFASVTGVATIAETAEKATGGAQVFYTGHSLIDNPLPEYVELIAKSLGKQIDWEEQIVIGSPLRARTWGDGNWTGYHSGKNRTGRGMDVAAELRRHSRMTSGRPYDTLVVAEAHTVIGTIIWENSVGYLRNVYDRMTDGNPEARTIYDHVWLGIDKSDPRPWIEYEKNASLVYQCVVRKVQLTLEAENRPARLSVMPGGTALVDLVQRILRDEVPGISGTDREKLDNIFRDDVHLTDVGIYFMAAVQYATIYGSSPEGAKAPPAVHEDTARALQTIAWNHVRTFNASVNLNDLTMEDCRKGIVENACRSYWTMDGRREEIGRCQGYFGNFQPKEADGNPFIWPDPHWKPLPYPAGD
jgi:hypothetical protein